MAQRILVNTPSGAYPVEIVEEGLEALGSSLRPFCPNGACFVVSDENVASFWRHTVEVSLSSAELVHEWVVLPPGEENKTTQTWATCVERLIQLGLTRDSVVVALGGGVVGDISGFAAASALRGVSWVQVPTTLLAMVDSSVGGKTGVNLSLGKNLVGSIWQPEFVYVTPSTLDTLPPREYSSGLGEVVKTALLDGPEFWNWLGQNTSKLAKRDPVAVREAVGRCVRFKADIVASDEREVGLRRLLNAGHTVGHALETVAGYGSLFHGEAVGLGLIAECRWAVEQGICLEADLPGKIQRMLQELGLPTVPPKLAPEALLMVMRLDKKARAGMLYVPVPERLGAFRVEQVPFDALEAFIGCLDS